VTDPPLATALGEPWPSSVIQAVADVLASTEWPGLSNTEIHRLLTLAHIPDLEAANKRTRLGTALHNQQQHDGNPGGIIRFLTEAMAIGRYLNDQPRFDALREALAAPLSLVGLQINEQGAVAAAVATATTLDEVAKLAGRLRTELRRRGVHPEVLRFCEEELLRKSLFHAVFEATKGVSDRLRHISGFTGDGAELVDQCFTARSGVPLLRINAYQTVAETSEQKGFANLLKGLFGTFRNPPAHTPRATTTWKLTEPDVLDLFCMLSFVHRRLDTVKTAPVA